jgi:hypothetical protein
MAGWTTSYVVPSTLVSALQANASRINLDLSSASAGLYLALYDNTVTPNVDTDPQSYNVAPWNTGESTGTNWSAGGVNLSLSGAGLTHQTGGNLKFAAGNISVANTTLSDAIYGCLIYDSLLSPEAAVCAVWFGGSGYTTSAGTFGITWPASGIWTIALVP